MAWTSPRTWVAGSVLTAAQLNVDVRDNENALYGGAMSIASQAAGDVLYAASATQLGRLAADSGKILKSGAGAPSWASLLTEMLAVDGAGSGLDADLLDGYNSAQSGADVVLRTNSSGHIALGAGWLNQDASVGMYNGNGSYWIHPAAASPHWYLYSASAAAAGIRLYTANAGLSVGYLYGDATYFGLLTGSGSWLLHAPSAGTYGSASLYGSKNGYAGLHFPDAYRAVATVMFNTTTHTTGFYNATDGWIGYWDGSYWRAPSLLSQSWLYTNHSSATGFLNTYFSIGCYAQDGTWLGAYPSTTYFRAQYLYSDALGLYAACGAGTAKRMPRWTGTYTVANSNACDHGATAAAAGVLSHAFTQAVANSVLRVNIHGVNPSADNSSILLRVDGLATGYTNRSRWTGASGDVTDTTTTTGLTLALASGSAGCGNGTDERLSATIWIAHHGGDKCLFYGHVTYIDSAGTVMGSHQIAGTLSGAGSALSSVSIVVDGGTVDEGSITVFEETNDVA